MKKLFMLLIVSLVISMNNWAVPTTALEKPSEILSEEVKNQENQVITKQTRVIKSIDNLCSCPSL